VPPWLLVELMVPPELIALLGWPPLPPVARPASPLGASPDPPQAAAIMMAAPRRSAHCLVNLGEPMKILSADHAAEVRGPALPAAVHHVEIAEVLAGAIAVVHAGVLGRMAIEVAQGAIAAAIPSIPLRAIAIGAATAVGIYPAMGSDDASAFSTLHAIANRALQAVAITRTQVVVALELGR
jgi:hypothetical protein